MKIAILGATGFIGRALVLALQGRGDELRVLTRTSDAEATRAAIDDADAVINLAGESIAGKRWTAARKRALHASRIGTTQRLVDAIATRRVPLPVLICASATGWYGDRGGIELDDRSRPGEGFAADLCVAWEEVAREAAAARIVHARFGVVLGREGGALDALLPIFRLGLGGPIGGGAQWMPWIHLEDAVRAIVQMLDDPRLVGPVAVVAPPVHQRDFARALGRALGRPAVIPVPAAGVRLVLGEAASILLASQRVIPRALAAAGFAHRFPTIEAALADIVDDGVTIERSGALPD
ncbi:MAG: TIGR01777 family protein, partial [Deltaproteobacteria bacterium]|nr:TIGR01777 family protein [Deltaproteobacteria bacterium]